MFRTLIFVTGLLLVSSSELTDQADPEEEKAVGGGDWQESDQLADCAIDSAEAIDGMMDGAVYLMAAITRCGGDGNTLDPVKCTVDVGASVSAVNNMINVVIKAVQKCGGFSTNHAECGMAAGVLTRSFGELTSASAGIVSKCPNPTYNGPAQQGGGFDGNGYNSNLGFCVINVKDSMRSLFELISRFMTLKTNCEKPDNCARNALKIVGSFVGIGQYISGALARCSNKYNSGTASCVQASLQLFRATDNVARAAEGMSENCALTPAERLFLADEGKVSSTANSNGSLTFGLVALLPITAVLSFVGGSRLAKVRAAQAQDIEMSRSSFVGLSREMPVSAEE